MPQLGANRRMASWLPPMLAGPALLLLATGFDAPLVLIAALTTLALIGMLARPELATMAVVFLLYTNAPAIAVVHGTPKPVAGALILLLGIPLLDRLIIRRERARSDFVFALMLAFLCVMLLTSLWARDASVAMERVFTFATEGLLLYWLFINTVTTRTGLRRVIWALLGAGVFLGSLSAYQSATRSYENDFGGFAVRNLEWEHKREQAIATGAVETRMYRSDRADGPQIGGNRYAQILLVLLPLAIAFARIGRRLRIPALTAAGVILVAIALTYSRGALLALGVLACASLWVAWLRPRHLVVGTMATLLLVPVVAPSVVQRITSLGQVTALEDPTADASLRGRATEMLAALHVFADHPVRGVGPGQYAPFYSLEYHQIPGIKFREIQTTRRAHSLYLEMAAELGVVGLAIFLVIPLLLLRALWRIRVRCVETDPELAETAAALWLSLIAFLFTAMFLSHAFERYYWLLIGLAGAALHISRTADVMADPWSTPTRRSQEDHWRQEPIGNRRPGRLEAAR